MDWLQKMAFPVRRAWFVFSARFKSRKSDAGLLKLEDDIQTCGYEDVQIMWEILRKTESEEARRDTRSKNRWLLRNFVRFGHGAPAPSHQTR